MALSVSTLHAPPHLACKSNSKSTSDNIPLHIPTMLCSTVASSCVGHALLTKSSPTQSLRSTAQYSSIVTQHDQCMPICMLRTPQHGTAQHPLARLIQRGTNFRCMTGTLITNHHKRPTAKQGKSACHQLLLLLMFMAACSGGVHASCSSSQLVHVAVCSCS